MRSENTEGGCGSLTCILPIKYHSSRSSPWIERDFSPRTPLAATSPLSLTEKTIRKLFSSELRDRIITESSCKTRRNSRSLLQTTTAGYTFPVMVKSSSSRARGVNLVSWTPYFIACVYYLSLEVDGLRILPMRMASSAPKSDRNELSKPKREFRTLRGMPCTGTTVSHSLLCA